MKVSWDNKHQQLTSFLQQQGYNGNQSELICIEFIFAKSLLQIDDKSIIPFSWVVLSLN